MRIKAIPAEAVNFITDNPLLLAGVAGVGVIGYIYVKRANVVADDVDASVATQPTYGSYGLAPLSTGGIVSYASGGSGAGIVDSLSNTAVLDANAQAAADKAAAAGVTNKDLFDFEVLKNSQAFELSKATLAANLGIAAMNADLQYAGIASQNYQISSGLTQAFLMSGSALAMGAVVAPDGSVTQFGFTQYATDTSKKGKATTRYEQVLQNSGLAQFLANASAPKVPAPAPMVGVSNGSFGSSGSPAASTYAGGIATPSLQSSGGNVTATVNGGGYNPTGKSLRRNDNEQIV